MNRTAEDANRRQFERRVATCVHFNGIMNNCCKADINYQQHTGGEAIGFTSKLPCLPHERSEAVVPCDLFQARGREAIEAEDKESKERLARTMVARAAIVEATNGEVGVEGDIECPYCCGKLRYSVASLNGHIWGQCSTEGCVRWME